MLCLSMRPIYRFPSSKSWRAPLLCGAFAISEPFCIDHCCSLPPGTRNVSGNCLDLCDRPSGESISFPLQSAVTDCIRFDSLCRTLALENLRDIRHFLQATSATASITRGTAWFSLYFGWQASLTLLLSMVWEPHAHEAPQWREVSIGLFFPHAI